MSALPRAARERAAASRAPALVRAGGVVALAALCACAPATTRADEPPRQPVINVTATANASVPNDRMRAVMRAEADDANAVQAASLVNGRIARALARAKAVAGVDVKTAGYSTFQVGEKGQTRWRVMQSLSLESGDFAALAALITRLQSDDGLLLSGVDFSVSPAARHEAEDRLMREAIRGWQDRAKLAAQAFGASGWRPGRVNVQSSEGGGPRPMFRAQAMAAGTAAPVNVEAGTSELAVTVSGEAVLDRAP